MSLFTVLVFVWIIPNLCIAKDTGTTEGFYSDVKKLAEHYADEPGRIPGLVTLYSMLGLRALPPKDGLTALLKLDDSAMQLLNVTLTASMINDYLSENL